MPRLSIKPAFFAGFLLITCFGLLPLKLAWSQNYVDNENEQSLSVTEQNAEPVDQSTLQSSLDQSYSGIRPYSGTTTIGEPPLEEPSSSPTAPNSGSLMLRIQQLEIDVRKLNGLLEEIKQALEVLEEQSLERYVDIDRRLTNSEVWNEASEQNADSGVSPVIGSTHQLDRTPIDLNGSEEGEEARYRSAYELVRSRKFEPAVTEFNRFLSDFPFGRFASNAHYWLGELYLVLDPPDPELARQSFKLLLDQYPADPKVPDALYKLGRVHFIKGNRKRSREYLNEVIREYPSHTAAQLSRNFLGKNF